MHVKIIAQTRLTDLTHGALGYRLFVSKRKLRKGDGNFSFSLRFKKTTRKHKQFVHALCPVLGVEFLCMYPPEEEC